MLRARTNTTLGGTCEDAKRFDTRKPSRSCRSAKLGRQSGGHQPTSRRSSKSGSGTEPGASSGVGRRLDFGLTTCIPVILTAILDILSGLAVVLAVQAAKLANRLKVARAERDLSQEQLARLVGVTRQTISSIETGLYSPSALLAFQLAETLGKRVDELFFLDGEPS